MGAEGLCAPDNPSQTSEATAYFQVVLEREAEGKFGIAYKPEDNVNNPEPYIKHYLGKDAYHTLLVSSIKADGACARHNYEMRHFQGSQLFRRQVYPRDRICCVNGEIDPKKMKEVLTTQRV